MPSAFELNANVNLNSASVNASAKEIQQALGRITGQASEFQKSLDASTARVFAFGATTAVLNGVTQSFKKLVATTIDVQKKLVEINSIFQATEATFNRFRNSIFQVAKETGQAFNTVAEGAAELARQGLSAEETAKRLKAALVLTRISGLDAEKSVKALTAAINGFASAGLTANQIVNKMVAVDTAFAVSAQDLAEAFSRAGSTAEDAGVSFNELLGLVTAVEQRTARGGAVIGNAFKSIFTRLARGGTIDQLRALGVEIDATQTGIQKLSALSAALDKISDPTKAAAIKELAGGVFQINVVSAALKDLSSETGIFAQAAVTASNATNEAFEKNAALNKTLAAQINTLVVGLTSLAEKIGKVTFGPLLENLVGLAVKFTEFLDKALDPEKGNVFIKGLFKTIGSFLGGPAVVIFTTAFIKIFALVAKFAKDGLKAVFQIGSQTQKIQSIEAGLVQLLSRDSELRKVIQSTTASQATKEQAIIAAIQRENALLTQQAAIMRSLATAAAARGVSGFGMGGFTGKGGKKFAGGFRQEEGMAKMMGAKNPRAARVSAQINGRQQNVVVNSEEDIIHNVGRNGDSAIIPRYAGGFVPNYSRFSQMIGIARQARTGKFPTRRKPVGDLSAAEANAAAQAGRRVRDKAKSKKKKPQTEQVALIDPKGSAMLVPNIGLTSKIPKGTAGRQKLDGKSTGYEYKSGLQVYGPKVPNAVDQAADPHDERLRESVRKSISTIASKYAGLLKPILGKPTPAKIIEKLEQQGGGKGALHGIVGAAFEASVNAALDLSPARSKEGGDFDVKDMKEDANRAVRTLFGVKAEGTKLFDYKENMGAGSSKSFAKKLYNQGKYTWVTRDVKKGGGGKKGKAAGFIPNFTRGGGVSASQIRIHRDADGRGEMITNTRDEPRGVQDAIKREKEGIGMFAGGFVPNYYSASPFPSRHPAHPIQSAVNQAVPNSGGKISQSSDKAAKSLDKVTKSSEKVTKSSGGQSDAGMKMMFAFGALQMGLNTLTSAIGGDSAAAEAAKEKRLQEIEGMNMSYEARMKAIQSANEEAEVTANANSGLVSLAEGADIAFSALMSFSALNMVTGGGMGKLGGKMFGGMGRGVQIGMAGKAGRLANAGMMARAGGQVGRGLRNTGRIAGQAGRGIMNVGRAGMGVMGGIGGAFKSVGAAAIGKGAGLSGMGLAGGGVAAGAASVAGIIAGLGVAAHDLTLGFKDLGNGTIAASEETLIWGKLLGGSQGKFQGFFDNLFGVGSKKKKEIGEKGVAAQSMDQFFQEVFRGMDEGQLTEKEDRRARGRWGGGIEGAEEALLRGQEKRTKLFSKIAGKLSNAKQKELAAVQAATKQTLEGESTDEEKKAAIKELKDKFLELTGQTVLSINADKDYVAALKKLKKNTEELASKRKAAFDEFSQQKEKRDTALTAAQMKHEITAATMPIGEGPRKPARELMRSLSGAKLQTMAAGNAVTDAKANLLEARQASGATVAGLDPKTLKSNIETRELTGVKMVSEAITAAEQALTKAEKEFGKQAFEAAKMFAGGLAKFPKMLEDATIQVQTTTGEVAGESMDFVARANEVAAGGPIDLGVWEKNMANLPKLFGKLEGLEDLDKRTGTGKGTGRGDVRGTEDQKNKVMNAIQGLVATEAKINKLMGGNQGTKALGAMLGEDTMKKVRAFASEQGMEKGFGGTGSEKLKGLLGDPLEQQKDALIKNTNALEDIAKMWGAVKDDVKGVKTDEVFGDKKKDPNSFGAMLGNVQLGGGMLLDNVVKMGENLSKMGKEFEVGRESFDNIATEVGSLNEQAAILYRQSKTALENLGKRLETLEKEYNSPSDDAQDAADALNAAENASSPTKPR